MVKTMNDMGNRQPDSNTGCSKQKRVKISKLGSWYYGLAL